MGMYCWSVKDKTCSFWNSVSSVIAFLRYLYTENAKIFLYSQPITFTAVPLFSCLLSSYQHPSFSYPGCDCTSPTAVLTDPIFLLAQPCPSSQTKAGLNLQVLIQGQPLLHLSPILCEKMFPIWGCLDFWSMPLRSQYHTVIHFVSYSDIKPFRYFAPLLDCQLTGSSTISYSYMDPGLCPPKQQFE